LLDEVANETSRQKLEAEFQPELARCEASLRFC